MYKLRKRRKTFLGKFGEPLIEEIQLEDENLKRTILDRMYINVITVNEIINSDELYTYLNPFKIDSKPNFRYGMLTTTL